MAGKPLSAKGWYPDDDQPKFSIETLWERDTCRAAILFMAAITSREQDHIMGLFEKPERASHVDRFIRGVRPPHR